jgi:hypothetical protein
MPITTNFSEVRHQHFYIRAANDPERSDLIEFTNKPATWQH